MQQRRSEGAGRELSQSPHRAVLRAVRQGAGRAWRDFRLKDLYQSVRGAAKDVPGAIGEPVVVGGAAIRNGDVLVLDADGVAVVEAERVDEVLEASRERAEKEVVKRAKLKDGALSYDLDRLRERVETAKATEEPADRSAKAPPSGAADQPPEAPPSGAADHPPEAPPSGAADLQFMTSRISRTPSC